MQEIENLHRRAMELAEQADAAGADAQLLRQAFELERAAALLAAERGAPQPSLGILYFSAATLGFECRMLPEAKALVDQALGWHGEMPDDLVADLRELSTDIAKAAPVKRSAP